MFRVPPSIGRWWLPEEHNAPVAVISSRLWTSRFNRDAQVSQREIILNGVQTAIVGVMPPAFAAPSPRVDVWIPLELFARIAGSDLRQRGVFQLIGRLNSGVAPQQASGDALRVASEIQPGRSDRVSLVRLQDVLTAGARLPVLTSLVLTTLILFVLCLNLGSLSLARSADRLQEFAIRAALGGSRRQLARQVLTEGLVLAMGGVAVALLVTTAATSALRAFPLPGVPRVDAVRVDVMVLAYSLLIGIGATALFAVLPAALTASKPRLADLLAQTPFGTGNRRHAFWRESLVVAQLAVAIVLTVGAVVVTRGLIKLLAADTGVDPGHVVVMRLVLPTSTYGTPDLQRTFFSRLLTELHQVQGIRHVGIGTAVPPTKSYMQLGITVRPDHPSEPARQIALDLVPVSEGFLPAIGARFRAGRQFTDRDNELGQPVAIVSERAAATLGVGPDPLGRAIRLSRLPMPSSPRTAVIIGVVADVRYAGLEGAPSGAVYVPFRQRPLGSAYIAVRTDGPIPNLAADLIRGIRAVDPSQTVAEVRLLSDFRDEPIAEPRARTLFASTGALLALIIAAAGVYGLVAYTVSQRTREIGIRMAIGASAGHVRALFLSQAGRMAALGAVCGATISYAAVQWAGSLMFGIGNIDLPLLTAAVAVHTALVFGAVYVPIRRATRLDPALTLRSL